MYLRADWLRVAVRVWRLDLRADVAWHRYRPARDVLGCERTLSLSSGLFHDRSRSTFCGARSNWLSALWTAVGGSIFLTAHFKDADLRIDPRQGHRWRLLYGGDCVCTCPLSNGRAQAAGRSRPHILVDHIVLASRRISHLETQAICQRHPSLAVDPWQSICGGGGAYSTAPSCRYR